MRCSGCLVPARPLAWCPRGSAHRCASRRAAVGRAGRGVHRRSCSARRASLSRRVAAPRSRCAASCGRVGVVARLVGGGDRRSPRQPPDEDRRALVAAVKRVRGGTETVVVVPTRARAVVAYYAPYLPLIGQVRGIGGWVAAVADTPDGAIAAARPPFVRSATRSCASSPTATGYGCSTAAVADGRLKRRLRADAPIRRLLRAGGRRARGRRSHRRVRRCDRRERRVSLPSSSASRSRVSAAYACASRARRASPASSRRPATMCLHASTQGLQ